MFLGKNLNSLEPSLGSSVFPHVLYKSEDLATGVPFRKIEEKGWRS